MSENSEAVSLDLNSYAERDLDDIFATPDPWCTKDSIAALPTASCVYGELSVRETAQKFSGAKRNARACKTFKDIAVSGFAASLRGKGCHVPSDAEAGFLTTTLRGEKRRPKTEYENSQVAFISAVILSARSLSTLCSYI